MAHGVVGTKPQSGSLRHRRQHTRQLNEVLHSAYVHCIELSTDLSSHSPHLTNTGSSEDFFQLLIPYRCRVAHGGKFCCVPTLRYIASYGYSIRVILVQKRDPRPPRVRGSGAEKVPWLRRSQGVRGAD